jgi:hypothetical protein
MRFEQNQLAAPTRVLAHGPKHGGGGLQHILLVKSAARSYGWLPGPAQRPAPCRSRNGCMLRWRGRSRVTMLHSQSIATTGNLLPPPTDNSTLYVRLPLIRLRARRSNRFRVSHRRRHCRLWSTTLSVTSSGQTRISGHEITVIRS